MHTFPAEFGEENRGEHSQKVMHLKERVQKHEYSQHTDQYPTGYHIVWGKLCLFGIALQPIFCLCNLQQKDWRFADRYFIGVERAQYDDLHVLW